MTILDEIRRYWDADAATYDRSPSHHPGDTEVHAWTQTLSGLLPEPPAAVLDLGAGTGFLSLILAGSGYRVTALDLAPAMLDALHTKAATRGVDIDTVEAPADEPPPGPFDVVIERHVLWLMPDPAAALEAWHRAAPDGRLVLLESRWGAAARPVDTVRAQGKELLRRARRLPRDHHREFDPQWRESLPLGSGTLPDRVRALVAASSWGDAQLTRLREVERAARRELPVPERLLGTAPRFAVTAGP